MAGGAAMMMGEAMGDMMGEAVGGMADGMGEEMGGESIDAEQIKAEIKGGIQEGFAEGSTEVEMEMSGPESFYDEVQCRRIAKAFGDSVRLIAGKEIAHDDGRKGFEALYAFDDINAVVVGQEISDLVMEVSSGESADEEIATMSEAYRFVFKKGRTATLSIKPPPTEEEMEQEWLADASAEDVAEYKKMMAEEAAIEEEDGDTDSMDVSMNAQMEEQMLAAFKSRKDSILLSVEGTVKDCNATHRSKKRPNALVLVHMDYDKILSDPKGKELLMNDADYKVDFIKAAQAANVPGLVVEDPTKTVVVTFK